MAEPCSIEGCERQSVARSWCQLHWARWRRNADPVLVKPKRNQGRPTVDYDDGTRVCNGCEARKPLADFPLDKNASKGRRSICKVCHTARQTERYNADPERHKARIAAHRLANIDEVRAADRQRYERDKDKRLALVIDAGHRRRARLKNLEVDDGITVVRLRQRDGDRCCYCRTVMDFSAPVSRVYRPTRATVEHVVPLTRGGGHTWDNVALACWRCNVRKNNKTPDEWTPDEVAPDENDEQLRLWA